MKSNRHIQALALAFLLLTSVSSLQAADDPSIVQPARGQIQQSMSDFIEERTVDGHFQIYDPTTDEVLKLKLVELHQGIAKKGEFFVSCADFVATDGTTLDLDFLVLKNDPFFTAQALVHKVNGTKRPYSLEVASQ